MDGADRRREPSFRAQGVAAGDLDKVVRPAAQFVDEVGDQIVEPAVLANQADERFPRNRAIGGEEGRFDAQHPFAPARGGRQVGEFHIEAFVPAPLATASGGAHRP